MNINRPIYHVKIKGSIEREGLVFIFKTLSDILKNEI